MKVKKAKYPIYIIARQRIDHIMSKSVRSLVALRVATEVHINDYYSVHTKTDLIVHQVIVNRLNYVIQGVARQFIASSNCKYSYEAY
jgi:hypothetical protein